MNKRMAAILLVLADLAWFSSVAQGESWSSAWFKFQGGHQSFHVDFSRMAVLSSHKSQGERPSKESSLTGRDRDFDLMGVDLVPRGGKEGGFGRGVPVRFASGGIGLLTNAILVGVDSFEEIRSSVPDAAFAEPLVAGANIHRVTFSSPEAALEAVRALEGDKRIRFVHPDFRLPIEGRGSVDPMREPLSPQAWHLKKSGVEEAWATTTGSSSVLVALIDLGFEVDHPDLAAAWAVNSAEIPGNRKDDDGNGLVDDVVGWNFGVRGPNLLYGAGPGHGTATAGIIAARANGVGVSGMCPNCLVLPLVIDDQVSSAVAAFLYAKNRGAKVISNSWGYRVGTPETEALTDAIQKVAVDSHDGLGASVLFAMGNKNRDDCRGPEPDISALPFVIAVSSADSADKKIPDAGYGSCLSILAPSSVGRSQGIVTTDRRGAKGFNTGAERGDLGDLDYTNSFHGTSAAAPQVAGALALLYAACPSLGAKEAYDLLVNSADKVRPDEARYDALTGRSLTYGFGRLNVAAMMEKVRSGSASQLCAVPKDKEDGADKT